MRSLTHSAPSCAGSPTGRHRRVVLVEGLTVVKIKKAKLMDCGNSWCSDSAPFFVTCILSVLEPLLIKKTKLESDFGVVVASCFFAKALLWRPRW